MVLAHSRPHRDTPTLKLDLARILGMAGAVAVNAAAMLMLMAPVSAPLPMDLPEEVTEIFTIEKEKPRQLPPPPQVEVRRQTTQTPIRQPLVAPQPQPDVPLIVDTPGPMDTPVPDIVASTTPGPVAAIIPTGPAEISALEYLSAPPPPYPPEALRQQIEGTVTLRVLVDVDGKPLEVEIKRSSGNRRLDDAARRQILRKWRFKPAIRDGSAIQVYGIVPVEFSLQ